MKHLVRQPIVLITAMSIIVACRSNQSIKSVDNQHQQDDQWFSVKYVPICDPVKGESADFDKIGKHGGEPYDMMVSENADSLTVSFDFIESGGLTFSGRAEVMQDILVLTYGIDKDIENDCGCWCDYRLVYRISKTRKDWKAMRISREKWLTRAK